MRDTKSGKMSKQCSRNSSLHRPWGIYLGWVLIFCFTIPVVATAQDVQSGIGGDCECDEESQTTTCTYTVISGRPALSHLLFPIPENCVGRFTVTSPFYTFSAPQTFNDQFCGEVFGIKADQELPEGQMTTFTITYEDVCDDGTIGMVFATVFAALKGGPNCELIPVQGVVDCPLVPCVDWSLDASEFDFYIRKPGIFASRLATMTVEANTQVNITFESFGDLVPVQASESDPIAAFYATAPAEQPNPPALFLVPADFNQQVLIIPGDDEPHQFSLWSKIVNEIATTACEYHDAATITLTLENHEPWIDDGN